MKKIKAMLAGIAVLAVVGGAFAFKAKSNYTAVLYTSVAPGQCTTSGNFITTLADHTHFPAKVYYTVESGACIATSTFYTTAL